MTISDGRIKYPDSSWSFDLRIREFNRILSFINDSIEREFVAIVERGKENEKGILQGSEEEYHALIFSINEENQVDELFRGTLLNSYVVTLHSFVEAELTAICNFYLKKDNTIRLGLEDLSERSTLERAKKYLTKVIGLDKSLFDQSEWREIIMFSKIRNCIVHDESCVSITNERNRKMIQYVKDKPDYFNLPARQIMLKEAYCTYITKQVASFFDKLYNSLQKDIVPKRS